MADMVLTPPPYELAVRFIDQHKEDVIRLMETDARSIIVGSIVDHESVGRVLVEQFVLFFQQPNTEEFLRGQGIDQSKLRRVYVLDTPYTPYFPGHKSPDVQRTYRGAFHDALVSIMATYCNRVKHRFFCDDRFFTCALFELLEVLQRQKPPKDRQKLWFTLAYDDFFNLHADQHDRAKQVGWGREWVQSENVVDAYIAGPYMRIPPYHWMYGQLRGHMDENWRQDYGQRAS